MPHFPTHPPYLFGLTRKHGDMVLEGNVSSSAEAIAFGGHVGTHIDALCHFSCDGKLYGGIQASSVQSQYGGFSELSVDTIEPILRRGVLLDIAAEIKMDALPAGFRDNAAASRSGSQGREDGDQTGRRGSAANRLGAIFSRRRALCCRRGACRQLDRGRNWKPRAG